MAINITFKGVFNYKREIYVLYTSATTEKRAWSNFCYQLARIRDDPIRYVKGHFSGQQDNFKITKEIEFVEVEE